MTYHRRLSDRLSESNGAVLMAVAFALMMLLAFAALAIDIGYLMVVRNELQNAADATILALAAEVYREAADPSSAEAESLAQNLKSTMVSLNKVANATLSDCQVPPLGYWNMTGSSTGLQPAGITPTVNDAAAVMVTVSKSPGNNGGPVNLFLAPIIGIDYQAVTAQAVAVVASPGYVGPGTTFPLAISKAMYDQYWDSGSAQPRIDPNTGRPYIFRIKSVYAPGDLQPGQWTSFKIDAGDLATMRNLISNGNPDPLAIGNDIWIQPGMPPELYSTPIPIGAVLIMVVSDITVHRETPIVAFGAFIITSAVSQGQGSYVEGHFYNEVRYYRVESGGPIGPKYGAYTHPKLVQ